jgi:hypothetical protein
MTTSYLKLNLSQLEHYYHLYYLDKYHNKCLEILNDNDIIPNVNYEFSKTYLDNKMSYELYNKIFKKDKVKELKDNVQSKSKNKKKLILLKK